MKYPIILWHSKNAFIYLKKTQNVRGTRADDASILRTRNIGLRSRWNGKLEKLYIYFHQFQALNYLLYMYCIAFE